MSDATKAQRAAVLQYLELHGRITQDEAYDNCQRTRRLAARICELRADGHDIETVMVPAENGNRFAEYRMEKKKAEREKPIPAFSCEQLLLPQQQQSLSFSFGFQGGDRNT